MTAEEEKIKASGKDKYLRLIFDGFTKFNEYEEQQIKLYRHHLADQRARLSAKKKSEENLSLARRIDHILA